jgi:hypothetical protein
MGARTGHPAGLVRDHPGRGRRRFVRPVTAAPCSDHGRPRRAKRLPGRSLRLLRHPVHRHRDESGGRRSRTSVRPHVPRMARWRSSPGLESRPGLLLLQFRETRPPARCGLDTLAPRTRRAPDLLSPPAARNLDQPAGPGYDSPPPDPAAPPHRGNRNDPVLEAAEQRQAAIILRADTAPVPSKRPTSTAQETKTFRLCQSRYLVAGAWASSGRSSTSRKGGRP